MLKLHNLSRPLTLICSFVLITFLLSSVYAQSSEPSSELSVPQVWNIWSSTIKNVVFAAAAAVGGIWAYFKFYALGEMKHAQIKYHETLASIKKLEDELREHYALVIEMVPTVMSSNTDGPWYISTDVVIRNIGSKTVRLEHFNDAVFSVRHVGAFDDEGKPKFEDKVEEIVRRARFPEHSALSTLIRKGGIESIPFIVKVPKPGIYFLAFHAPLSNEATADAKEIGATGPMIYTGKKYILVSSGTSTDD